MSRIKNSRTGAPVLRVFNSLAEISDHDPFGDVTAHRHMAAYAAIALRGEYTEISADGILIVSQGDVVIHPLFHWHANVFASSPVSVLNLSLPTPVGMTLPYARLRMAELPCSQDDIVCRPRESAERIAEALARFGSDRNPLTYVDPVGFAWKTLREPCAPKIHQVAADAGVSCEHLAREFRARYGLSPVEYRAEHRFRHTVRSLSTGESAAVAADSNGYSDQSHMTRDFRRRVGFTPRQCLQFISGQQVATC